MRPTNSSALPSTNSRSSRVNRANICFSLPLAMFQFPLAIRALIFSIFDSVLHHASSPGFQVFSLQGTCRPPNRNKLCAKSAFETRSIQLETNCGHINLQTAHDKSYRVCMLHQNRCAKMAQTSILLHKSAMFERRHDNSLNNLSRVRGHWSHSSSPMLGLSSRLFLFSERLKVGTTGKSRCKTQEKVQQFAFC